MGELIVSLFKINKPQSSLSPISEVSIAKGLFIEYILLSGTLKKLKDNLNLGLCPKRVHKLIENAR